MNPKGQPFTWSARGGLPEVYTPLRGAAYKERATSESRTPSGVFIPPCGVLRRVADPFFIALLGGVKWQSNKYFAEKLQKPL